MNDGPLLVKLHCTMLYIWPNTPLLGGVDSYCLLVAAGNHYKMD